MNTCFDFCQVIAERYNADVVSMKDNNSHYIASNQGFLSFIGLSDVDQLYDKTDYDLPHAHLAEQYIMNDKESMINGNLQVLEPTVSHAGESKLGICHKYSFSHPTTHLTGSLCIAKIINPMAIEKSIHLLKNHDLQQLKISAILFGVEVNLRTKIPLTERELDIFYYILHGRSQKQVANKLGLSIRTVEGYVDNIKVKLKCGNKHQLFDFAIQNNLITIIPRRLLN